MNHSLLDRFLGAAFLFVAVLVVVGSVVHMWVLSIQLIELFLSYLVHLFSLMRLWLNT